MWTPKRIFLLVGGFLAFTLVYLLYSLTALGRINTLPPLPDQYKPSAYNDDTPVVRAPRTITPTLLERKLEMAFHPGCEELTWPVRLELNSKSMVIAAWKFELADRGRIKLELMSLALFGKKKNDGREIEINTLKCKQAYITFDRPITVLTPSELNGRKVVEAELFGDTAKKIQITNNRRTAARDDDLVVEIDTGPLYYIEKTQLVRTSDHVHLMDGDPRTDSDGRLIHRKADIHAQGMEMELATTAPPPRPGIHPSNRSKNETISGVKRIVLKEAVDMYLCVAGGGPFPGNEKAKAAAPREKKAEKQPGRDANRSSASDFSLVHIQTPGRFDYELLKDHDMARFDVPTSTNLPNSPQDVTVTRINQQTGNNDILVCKHLELLLRRRNNDAPTTRDAVSTEQGLEIETVHATGPDVTLTSDAEKLDAHGNHFFHDSAKKLTILKGTPYMEANKEDSLIQAPELRIQDVPLPVRGTAPLAVAAGKGQEPVAKTYQQIEASGPGSIHMTNKSTGKQNVHAYWNDKLVSTRDGELDLLILTGAAKFVDDQSDQWLKAETLKVWLLGEDKKPVAQAVVAKNAASDAKPQAANPSAVPGSSRRPHHVEALRNVSAHSPELKIPSAARLVIKFNDVPTERMPPPSSSAAANNKPGPAPLAKNPSVGDPPPAVKNQSSEVRKEEKRVEAAPAQPAAPAAAAGKPSSTPQPPGNGVNPSTTTAAPGQKPGPDPARPIELRARSIEAKVLRCNERMVLDHLWAEGGSVDKRGGVEVRQEPAKPGEEGVYIEGNTLDMKCKVGGNVLVVTGDLAKLKMDKIFILGPEVNIDQVDNRAWVIGGGAMQMQSTTTLEGKPLARPVPLTVHWGDNMVFFGVYAQFWGNIQAEQDNARLACQVLQVFFDKPISLKEGMRGTQPAKVSKLVADKGDSNENVRVEDQTFEAGTLQKYQLMIGTAMQMNTVARDEETPAQPAKNNDANHVTLYGPGSVRIMQRGDSDLTLAPGNPAPNQPAPAKKANKDQQMKLTYVTFMKQMQASSLNNTASFWESVRVLNMPCDDPHYDIDLDNILTKELPEGALYLRCNRLRVGTYQKTIVTSTGQKQFRTYQVMFAYGQVYVEGKDFTAQCDQMTFNEEKDQVIFDGEGDHMAVMSKGEIKGGPRKTMKAKRFTYIRSTGTVSCDKIESIQQ